MIPQEPNPGQLETAHLSWDLEQLERDPLPRWALLCSFEARAIATGISDDGRIANLRARYLQWGDEEALTSRLTTALLALDGMPALFDSESALDWLPPWVSLELSDAWWAWREVMLRRGEKPAAAAAARTVGAPPRLLAEALDTWERMHSELAASAADARCTVAINDWHTYVDSRGECAHSTLLVEALARTRPVVWPAAPTCALWRLEGATALLAARLQLAEHPIVIFQGSSDDETLGELARALAHPTVSKLTSLARRGTTAPGTGGIRTLRVA